MSLHRDVETPEKAFSQDVTKPAEFPEVNFYRVLNVASTATQKEIREAYLRLKSLYSGDNQALYSMVSDQEAQRTIAQLEEAFFVLNDDARRDAFDSRVRKAATAAGLDPEAQPFGLPSSDLREINDPGNDRSFARIRTTAAHATENDIQTRMLAMIEEGDLADGDLLRRIRESCNVTINEMQERTKILADYIRGIEENRFERLPPVVYVKGFLRSYLKYLAVPNLERLVNAYSGRLEAWRVTNTKN